MPCVCPLASQRMLLFFVLLEGWRVGGGICLEFSLSACSAVPTSAFMFIVLSSHHVGLFWHADFFYSRLVYFSVKSLMHFLNSVQHLISLYIYNLLCCQVCKVLSCICLVKSKPCFSYSRFKLVPMRLVLWKTMLSICTYLKKPFRRECRCQKIKSAQPNRLFMWHL